MTWFSDFYSSSVAMPLSLGILAVINILSWKKNGHQVILALPLFLFARLGVFITGLTLSWADGLPSCRRTLSKGHGRLPRLVLD